MFLLLIDAAIVVVVVVVVRLLPLLFIMAMISTIQRFVIYMPLVAV
jgi:hypothetical protein